MQHSKTKNKKKKKPSNTKYRNDLNQYLPGVTEVSEENSAGNGGGGGGGGGATRWCHCNRGSLSIPSSFDFFLEP